MGTDEVSKYEGKGDFGPYNEPSWVPEGKCKCCAMVIDDLTKAPRRREPSELRNLTIVGYTVNKNLEIYACAVCT